MAALEITNAICQNERMRSSRAYTHLTCGNETVIADSHESNHYSGMCNPFYHASATYCAACGSMDSLAKFEWSDTRESIDVYRCRLKSMVPGWAWAAKYALAFLFTWGPPIALWFATGRWWAALIGLVVGWVVHRLFTAKIVAKVAGVDFRDVD